jgi:hypothetical protein
MRWKPELGYRIAESLQRQGRAQRVTVASQNWARQAIALPEVAHAAPPLSQEPGMSPSRRTAAIVSLLLLTAAPAGADSLSERRAAKEKAETIEVEVACGKLDNENCAVIVPEINSKTVSQNVRLKPL